MSNIWNILSKISRLCIIFRGLLYSPSGRCIANVGTPKAAGPPKGPPIPRPVQQPPTVFVFRSADSEPWAGRRMALHTNGTVEFDGSPPHGSWVKQMSPGFDDILHIHFHCKGEVDKIKRHLFIRVHGTDCFEMMLPFGSKPAATLMPPASGYA